MKKLALLALVLNFSTQAFAFDTLQDKCFKKAAVATAKFAGSGYDKDGFETYECALAPNKAVILCNVAASKGEGAAIDTYRVILDKACNKVFRVDLTGEE